MEFLNHLKIAKFKFIIEATQPIWLPEYKGSTFRGAFGATFKRIVCVQRQAECESCALKTSCAYYYVFESPNPMTLPVFDSPRIPQPFVLEPPENRQEHFPEGSSLGFHLVLVGKAIDYLPYFIYTFDEMGSRGGIGKDRRHGQGRFQLGEVEDGFSTGTQVYDGATKMMTSNVTVKLGSDWQQTVANDIEYLKLNFQTPTRIKHQGKYALKSKHDSLDFQLLVENLYRRLFMLTCFHCELDGIEFQLPQTSDVTISSSNLFWRDWERYSNRQQARMMLGGFVGTVAYQGKLQPWLPLVRAGETVHLGKATTFGLGKYEIK